MTTPRPSLTLTLLQAREATMAFFRPALNAHDLTEQQWRVIRILRQQGELERDGIVARRKSAEDQRRVFINLTDAGQQAFVAMSEEMARNYDKILAQFGEDKLQQLMQLLDEMKRIKP